MSEEPDEDYWVTRNDGGEVLCVWLGEPIKRTAPYSWGCTYFYRHEHGRQIAQVFTSSCAGDLPSFGGKIPVKPPVFRNGKVHLKRKETP